MLQFKFRLTEREFATSLHLNRTFIPMRWKIYLLVIASMLPSLATFYLLDAGWSMAWFVVMIGVLLVYAISAYFKKIGMIQNYDQELTLTETSFSNKFSYSQSNQKWGLLDSIEETTDSFRLMRLQRCSYLPKRILGSRIDECRELFSRVINLPLSDAPTVDLYEQVFQVDSSFPVYEFNYVAEDLDLAHQSHFQIARNAEPESDKPYSGNLWFFLIFIGLLVGLLGWLTFDWQHESPLYFAALIAAWLLPLGLMLAYVKLVKLRSRKQARTPNDICKLRLTQSAWAIGNEDGVVLFDWRDVSNIYDSMHFFGFKTINQLLHLVPKRIFADGVAKTRFLSQALELQRGARRESEPVVATVVETGNPYQSPSPRN